MSRVLDLIRGLSGNASTSDVTATNTPPTTDNTAKVATTAWAKVGFAVSKSANGYIKFPTWLGGLIIQWGTVASVAGGGSVTVTYPLAFPNACLSVVAVAGADSVGKVPISGVNAAPANTTSFLVYNSSSSVATQPGMYIAIGH